MILAVDTSTQSVGLALFDGNQVIGEMVWQSRNHHTVEIGPAIEQLFKQCGSQYQDLKGCGVALGPGSFTSLRIGLAIVKGLALSLHIPVVGIPTLEILAASQSGKEVPMAAVLQAGRSRLVVGWYIFRNGSWINDKEAEIMTVEELFTGIENATYICGELSVEQRQLLAKKRRYISLASPVQSVRRPALLASMAWNKIKAGKIDDVVSLSPIYLHIANPIL
jgi:tRNA threonylcarbamoyladenosine biosynthesis protein TsaB